MESKVADESSCPFAVPRAKATNAIKQLPAESR
jgi:hypothetical protein